MNHDFEDIDLDQLLKEKLGDYKEAPSAENWQRFERNFAPKLISYRKFNRYRYALYGGVAVAATLAIMLIISNLKTDVSPSQLNLVQSQKTQTTGQTTVGLEGKSQMPSNQKTNHKSIGLDESSSLQSNIVSKVATDPALSNLTEVGNNFMGNIARYNDQLSSSPALLNPIGHSSIDKNSAIYSLRIGEPVRPSNEKTKILKIKKNRSPLFATNNASRNAAIVKRSFRKNNFKVRNSNQKAASNSGLIRILSKFEYKINITPRYASQTLNNKGSITLLDYDPQYYKAIEKGKFVLSGGLEIVYPINGSWGIYSGLKIAEYKRETTNDYSHLKIGNGQIVAPTSAGNILIHGLAENQLTGQTTFQTILRLQSIEIPFIARFQIGKNFYLDGGLSYSYLIADKTQTSLIGADLKYSFDQISGIRKHDFGLIFGTGFSFVTRTGLKFDAGPEISWNLTSLNTKSDLINKRLTFGIRTAISLLRF